MHIGLSGLPDHQSELCSHLRQMVQVWLDSQTIQRQCRPVRTAIVTLVWLKSDGDSCHIKPVETQGIPILDFKRGSKRHRWAWFPHYFQSEQQVRGGPGSPDSHMVFLWLEKCLRKDREVKVVTFPNSPHPARLLHLSVFWDPCLLLSLCYQFGLFVFCKDVPLPEHMAGTWRRQQMASSTANLSAYSWQ